jgi:hypothetical protein
MAGDLNRDMRRRAEAVEPEARPGADFGEPETPKAYDAGAKQGGRLEIGERRRQFVYESFRGGGVFGVAAVYCPSGELGIVAKVLATALAEFASAAGSVQPGNAYSRTFGDCACARSMRLDYADDLVAGNDARLANGKLTLRNVQVCAAHPAGVDADEHFAVGGFAAGDFRPLKRRGFHRGWSR